MQASLIIPSITSDGIAPIKIGGTRHEFVSKQRDRSRHQWHKGMLEKDFLNINHGQLILGLFG